MKKLSGSIILTGMLLFANAQIKVGIEGGVNQSTIVETNSLPGWNSIKNNYTWLQGFHGGVFAQLPVNKKGSLIFEPSVIYFNKGRKYFQQFDTSNNVLAKDSSFKQQLNYIDIPLNLLLKFRLGNNARFIIGGGPYASFFFNGSERSVTNYKDPVNYPSQSVTNKDLPVGKAPGKYTTIDYGASVTAGIEFGRVMLRASASQSLGDMYEAADYKGSFRNRVVSITLGVTLGTLTEPVTQMKIRDTTAQKPRKLPDSTTHKIRKPNEHKAKKSKIVEDRDGDGVPDKQDKCPDVKGPASNKGCPLPDIDTDGDGIPDSEDKCPTVKGLARYNGCPMVDTDGDYIPDEEDLCPTVPGVYRYHGCPIPDSDSDGVNDEIDRCPHVPGLRSNHGCPLSADTQIKTANDTACYTAYFEFNVSNLESQAFNLLEQIMRKLKTNEKLEVTIKGYTDNVGSDAANNKLSADRAQVVADYISSYYISRNRLHISSYGKLYPVVDANIVSEQWKNRRVEICVYIKQ